MHDEIFFDASLKDTPMLGFTRGTADGPLTRFVADAPIGGIVDLRAAPGLPRGRQGGGSVHHVAFRATNDDDQTAMVRKLTDDRGSR